MASSRAAAPAVSVVVMAFDEQATLAATVKELQGELTTATSSYEIVIVDDGSTDGTGEQADRIAAQRSSHTRVVHHERNLGLGGVYRTGFREARGDFVTFFPADGQFPASIVGQFLPLMAASDMVLGYIDTGERGTVARWLSRVERWVYGALFGRLPRFQGILMFRRELLDRFPLRSQGRGWTVLMELILCAHRSGCRLRSAQTPFRPRRAGASKVQNISTIWANLAALVRLRRDLHR